MRIQKRNPFRITVRREFPRSRLTRWVAFIPVLCSSECRNSIWGMSLISIFQTDQKSGRSAGKYGKRIKAECPSAESAGLLLSARAALEPTTSGPAGRWKKRPAGWPGRWRKVFYHKSWISSPRSRKGFKNFLPRREVIRLAITSFKTLADENIGQREEKKRKASIEDLF